MMPHILNLHQYSTDTKFLDCYNDWNKDQIFEVWLNENALPSFYSYRRPFDRGSTEELQLDMPYYKYCACSLRMP